VSDPSLASKRTHSSVRLSLSIFSWSQIYILDGISTFVPQTPEDAEILAERISVRLSAANSAVVLAVIKVLLYLMNYMEDKHMIEGLCKKMGPPLGKCYFNNS
jgi:vesicle coat complex subunit